LDLFGEGDLFGDRFELRLLGDRDVFRLVPNSDFSGFGVVTGFGDEAVDFALADIIFNF
jgi:hypothetical protein